MEKLPLPLQRLVKVFERLPGIGPRTAARLVFYLLQTPAKFIDDFTQALNGLRTELKKCSICHNVDVTDPCHICTGDRDSKIICVVERPLDILAVENSGVFRGVYHVLGGVINPLLHVSPQDLNIDSLLQRLDSTATAEEIIIATNPTMEGEATALYLKKAIASKVKSGLKITRIGHGLPMGADLDYADPGTLVEALKGRQSY